MTVKVVLCWLLSFRSNHSYDGWDDTDSFDRGNNDGDADSFNHGIVHDTVDELDPSDRTIYLLLLLLLLPLLLLWPIPNDNANTSGTSPSEVSKTMVIKRDSFDSSNDNGGTCNKSGDSASANSDGWL